MRGRAISVSGLTKYHGDFLAVDDIDFLVEHGEVFRPLGPYDAQRTIAIKVLTLLLQPEGVTKIWGYDLQTEPSQARKSISIAFRDLSLDAEAIGVLDEASSRIGHLIEDAT